jgi:hypothetical protein
MSINGCSFKQYWAMMVSSEQHIEEFLLWLSFTGTSTTNQSKYERKSYDRFHSEYTSGEKELIDHFSLFLYTLPVREAIDGKTLAEGLHA